MVTGAYPATRPARHGSRSSSQKRPWSGGSTTTTSTAACRSATSCEPSTPSRSPLPRARPSGGTPRCAGSSPTRPMSGASISTRPRPSRPRPRPRAGDAPRQPSGGDPGRSGSRSPVPPSSTTLFSGRLSESAVTTPNGARATSTTRPGCCADWSAAAPAGSASTPTSWAATPTRSIATTPAGTRPVAASPASSSARNAPSAQRSSTPSSSRRSRLPSFAPGCCAPARRRCGPQRPQPTMNCSAPNWIDWPARSMPTGPSGEDSPTCTSPGYSSSTRCNGGHERLTPATTPWPSSATN